MKRVQKYLMTLSLFCILCLTAGCHKGVDAAVDGSTEAATSEETTISEEATASPETSEPQVTKTPEKTTEPKATKTPEKTTEPDSATADAAKTDAVTTSPTEKPEEQ